MLSLKDTIKSRIRENSLFFSEFQSLLLFKIIDDAFDKQDESLASKGENTSRNAVTVIDENYQYFNGVVYKKNKNGYFRAQIGTEQLRIHVEVWSYFNGRPPEGYIVHHIDLDPSNNELSNLELMTRSEHITLHNNIEKTRTVICEYCGKPFSSKCKNAKYCSKLCYKRAWNGGIKSKNKK